MVVNIFIFLAISFLLTFIVGRQLEKVKIPWIFSALLLGSFLSIYNPFQTVTSSSTFEFLAQLGMYFLLFIIGFEIDLGKLKKSRNFIFRATFFIIFLEAVLGAILIHFVFGYSWFISSLVALSFATVGEAILIPILDEFKIINTKLGQSIISIGTLDDIIEIILLIFIGIFIGSNVHSGLKISLTIISLAILVILTMGLKRLKRQTDTFKFLSIESLFLFLLFVLFLFVGIGELANIAPLAALLAGIATNTFIPDRRVERVKSGVKTLCYGFFAPIFFLWVGATMDMRYLFSFPLLVLLIVLFSNGSKVLGSWLIGRKELGSKGSILLGIGLSARFSTSIIIIKILFEDNFIGNGLYSVIIASGIIFNFIIPALFSYLLVRWNIASAKN